MCGNGPWGFVIGGLILAAAMLASAYLPGHQAARVIELPHVVMQASPLSVDINLADARVVIDVSL